MALVQLQDNMNNIDDEEESKFDDEEDPMLDEMLQKAEQLRLAMLAASSTTKTVSAVSAVSGNTPSIINNKTTSKTAPRPLLLHKNSNRSIGSQRSKVSIARSTTMPAIPETIEMEHDNATECSSVGYYSIVYANHPINAKTNNNVTKTNNNVAQLVVEEEEEKTNEDGSVHQALSNSYTSSSRRQHSVLAPPIMPIDTRCWKKQQQQQQLEEADVSPKSCNLPSPLAIAPEDDEMVSVADYHNPSKSNTNSKDDVTWIKVTFVEQQDDDYVSLQDYSRNVSAPTATTQVSRKHRRKMLTFGLVCAVLVSLYWKISFKTYPRTPLSSAATFNTKPTDHVIRAEPALTKTVLQTKSIATENGLPATPIPVNSKNSQMKETAKQGAIDVKAASSLSEHSSFFNSSATPKSGFLHAIIFPGRLWQHAVANDRRLILEDLGVALLMT